MLDEALISSITDRVIAALHKEDTGIKVGVSARHVHLSQKDLEIRGPGEFFGTRQHGLPELKVANIFKHIKILKSAQLEARYIIGNDPKLQLIENNGLKEEILYKFSERREISLN